MSVLLFIQGTLQHVICHVSSNYNIDSDKKWSRWFHIIPADDCIIWYEKITRSNCFTLRALKNCLPCSLQVLKTNEESEWVSWATLLDIRSLPELWSCKRNKSFLFEKDFFSLSHPTQQNNFGNGKWRFYKFLFRLRGNINCWHLTLRKLV